MEPFATDGRVTNQETGEIMDCKQLQQCIDDYLDGTLPAGEQRLAEQHLAGCADCQAELNQIQDLRHTLRALPVPAPSPDFTRRVLNNARQQQQRRQRLLGGLATAMAASLVMWIGVALFQPSPDAPGIDAIAMGVSETREVKLVFNAPEDFQQVTLQLELSGNIELSGFAGRRDIEWQAALKKGGNTLVLPITATGHGQAEVIARIKHQGKTRIFRVPFKVNKSGAQLQSVKIPVTV